MLKTIGRFAVSATISGVATFLALSIPFLPSAAHAEETRSIRVTYADLNVTTAAGRKVLDRRIRAAARSVCGIEMHSAVRASPTAVACMDEAILRASGVLASRGVTGPEA